MAEILTSPTIETVELPLPDVSHLVTEDDTPVDNLFCAKQRVLLTHPLNAFWKESVRGKPFLAVADVGLYYSVNEPALVPDMMLSLDFSYPEDIWEKRKRSYLVWEYGKAPDVAIEVVSNTIGGETEQKMERYARAAVPYYVVFDPLEQVQDGKLRVFCLNLPLRTYEPCSPDLLPGVGLGLALWQGHFEGWDDLWLRWIDSEGRLIPTAEEAIAAQRQLAQLEKQRADAERERADAERERADAERERADAERERAERLAARLRELGVDPQESSQET